MPNLSTTDIVLVCAGIVIASALIAAVFGFIGAHFASRAIERDHADGY